MKSVLTTAALIACFSVPQPAWAAFCNVDTIETVSSDGEFIILESGKRYDVDASDEVTVSSWQEGDDVLVCNGHTIIEGGERVEVTPHVDRS